MSAVLHTPRQKLKPPSVTLKASHPVSSMKYQVSRTEAFRIFELVRKLLQTWPDARESLHVPSHAQFTAFCFFCLFSLLSALRFQIARSSLCLRVSRST